MTGEQGAGGMSVDPTTLAAGVGSGASSAPPCLRSCSASSSGALLIWLSGALSPAGFDPSLPLTAYLALLDGSVLCADGFAEGGFGCEGGLLLDFRGIGNALNSATPLILRRPGGRIRLPGRPVQHRGATASSSWAPSAPRSRRLPGPAVPPRACRGAAGRRAVRGLLGLHPGLPQGMARGARGGRHDHAQLRRLPVAEPARQHDLPRPGRDVPAHAGRRRGLAAGAALRRHDLLPADLQASNVHGGIVIAVLVAILVWFLLFKTTLGFEIRTVGANPMPRATRGSGRP